MRAPSTCLTCQASLFLSDARAKGCPSAFKLSAGRLRKKPCSPLLRLSKTRSAAGHSPPKANSNRDGQDRQDKEKGEGGRRKDERHAAFSSSFLLHNSSLLFIL